MHKSQLAGFIIDCETNDLEAATDFWAKALGLEAETEPDPAESSYRKLDTGENGMVIDVQQVGPPSRVHLDIETNDIQAEVQRLEQLGARRVAEIKRWVVMESPTGQRFCVVNPQRGNFEDTANSWD